MEVVVRATLPRSGDQQQASRGRGSGEQQHARRAEAAARTAHVRTMWPDGEYGPSARKNWRFSPWRRAFAGRWSSYVVCFLVDGPRSWVESNCFFWLVLDRGSRARVFWFMNLVRGLSWHFFGLVRSWPSRDAEFFGRWLWYVGGGGRTITTADPL